MLRAHKNRLYEAVKEAGFRAAQFTTEEKTLDFHDGVEPTECFLLTLKNTPLQFITRISPNDYDAFDRMSSLCAPGWPLSVAWPPGDRQFVDIDLIAFQLGQWLQEVANRYLEEETVPDFWAEAQAQAESFLPSYNDPQREKKFSAQEKKLLELAIAQVRKEINRALKPTASELKLINERLDYLSHGVGRLNRLDWKNILVSTMIGIVINLSLDTTRGAQLYQIFKEAFSMSLHLLK
jgi:hypothetical protein